MENLIVAIALYVVLVAIAYQPKPAASPAEIEEIPTPEVEEIPDWEKEMIAAAVDNRCTTTPEPTAKPVTVTQALPSAAYVAPKPVATNGDRRLEEMTIRQLYALAAAKGIKRYKSKSKAALLVELSQ